MKSLIAAVALTALASPSFALPINGEAGRDVQATETVQQVATHARANRNRVVVPRRTYDPDAFIRDYDRSNPPHSWYEG